MTRWLILMSALLAAVAAVARVPQRHPPRDSVIQGDTYPQSLSEFGFFDNGGLQMEAAFVRPYRLNTPLYSDSADKLRFVYIPPGKHAVADGEGLLQFPVGSALIKTFAFTEHGKRRLIETRVMLHRADGWIALPYLWNAEQTEARLALAGAKVPVVTPAGEAIAYRVPNKNQCKECHGVEGKVVPIGPKTRNLTREWLAGVEAAGMLDHAPEVAAPLPLWEDHRKALPEAAARAYLDVNCAHCHQPGATASNSGLDLRWEQADPKALGVMKRPVAAGRGSGNLLFDVVPGKPDESIMVHRMASTEGGVAMPELGKATVDHEGLAVVERWIAGL